MTASFNPKANITRAQAAKIALFAAKITPSDLTNRSWYRLRNNTWHDPVMQSALDKGLLQNYFGFAYPDSIITKGEAEQMMSVLKEANRCAAPAPLDPWVYRDGCPEYQEYDPQLTARPGVTIVPGASGDDGELIVDFRADLRPGDGVFATILSDDGKRLIRQSEMLPVPQEFFTNLLSNTKP